MLGGLAGAALIVLSAVNVMSAATAGTPYGERTAVLASLVPPVREAVEPAGGEVLVSGSLAGVIFARGLVLELERQGIDAKVSADRVELFGENRVADDDRVRSRLFVAVDDEVADLAERPGLGLLARWDSVPPPEQTQILGQTADLDADLAAGRVTPEEHLEALTALADRLRVDSTGRYRWRSSSTNAMAD